MTAGVSIATESEDMSDACRGIVFNLKMESTLLRSKMNVVYYEEKADKGDLNCKEPKDGVEGTGEGHGGWRKRRR